MLGFGHVGQTYVSGLPPFHFKRNAPESLTLSDRIKKIVTWHNPENITLTESDVDFLIVVLKNIPESLHLSDATKYKVIWPIVETMHVLEGIKKHIVWHPIQEVLTIADNVEHKICYFIEETITLTGKLFVNGKEVVLWWEACLKKGIAEVTNVYHKFRGRGVL